MTKWILCFLCCCLLTDLQRLEAAWTRFQDAVDAVGDVEAVGPVVVRNLAVVLPDSDEEPCLGVWKH